jgi:hypothetical protein
MPDGAPLFPGIKIMPLTNADITDRALRGYPASLRHAARAAWEPLRPTSSVIALPDASLVPPARR